MDAPAATPDDPMSADDPTDEAEEAPRSRVWLKRLAIGGVVLAAIAVGRAFPVDEWLETVKSHVAGMGAWGPIAYGLFYVAAALLFVPGSAITIAAGALFGLGLGTLTVSLASTAAAAIAFPLSRTLLRARMEAFLAERPSFKAVDEAVAEGGWKIVGLLRLSPVLPFVVLNYALGLTGVRYVPAVLVSWITMLPGTLLYVYFGAAGAKAAAGGERSWEEWAVLGVGLVATLVVTVVLTRLARKRMRERDIHLPDDEGDTAQDA